MKKLYTTILITICTALMITSCAKKNDNSARNEEKDDSKKISIVCTIFPEYDWVRSIVGTDAKNIEITLLLDKGVDLHSYQPSVIDIAKISSCNMLVYTGGESDGWITDALQEAVNKNIATVNLMQVLSSTIKEEELVEGMQVEEEHHHDDEDHGEEEHHHEEEPEYDEHIWLSLKCAQTACNAITETLARIDSGNAEKYRANNTAYTASLASLDAEYAQVVNNAKNRTILFGDRFPFRYLADDYNLSYYAAFVGCSAETEASFETIIFLANKLDELNLPVVLTIENPRHTIAQTIIQNSKNPSRPAKVLNSMQSVTKADIASGETYVSIMKENLHVLQEALN